MSNTLKAIQKQQDYIDSINGKVEWTQEDTNQVLMIIDEIRDAYKTEIEEKKRILNNLFE